MLAVIALVALAPGVAVAQDAGGDQYTDPLKGNSGGGGGGNGGGGGSGGNSHVTPATATPTETAQTDTGSSQSTPTTAQAKGQLPATGMDSWLLAMAGGSMLLVGVGLRRVAAHPNF
jgi:LPXTG-motif cell wall-anchored protein